MFVILTEDFYGGGQDDIRAFSVRDAAIEYAFSLSKRINIDCIVSQLPDGKFLVVTEQYYGGDKKQSFHSYEEAQTYQESLSVDSFIVNL